MNIIYKPKGPAREYAGLALNIYTGCSHGCKYCYAPGVLRKKRDVYHQKVYPKKDVVRLVRKDCERLATAAYKNLRGNLPPEILISFIGDPYTVEEDALGITRKVIKTLKEFDLPFTILTKGGSRAARDFDLLKDYSKASFGTSMVFFEQEKADVWEPGAATITSRMMAIWAAKRVNIPTWVSLEPVIDPDEALNVIRNIHGIVDHWKVGKLNYWPEYEKEVDWVKFRKDVTALLDSLRADYYIKESLRKT